MDLRDVLLGMDRDISRRDFINGVGVAVAAALLPGCAKSGDPSSENPAAYYPPAATGMRGSHAGSFEAAHAAIHGKRWPHGYAFSVDAETDEVAWWPSRWKKESRPWVDARQRVGNIAFAGTDASSNAMTESAIEEAHRSVRSLMTEGAGEST